MVQETLLGFPAHTLPYRCGKFITLSTASQGVSLTPCFFAPWFGHKKIFQIFQKNKFAFGPRML